MDEIEAAADPTTAPPIFEGYPAKAKKSEG